MLQSSDTTRRRKRPADHARRSASPAFRTAGRGWVVGWAREDVTPSRMRFNGRAAMNVIEFASKPWRNGQMVVR
jgi:hypothetical protein